MKLRLKYWRVRKGMQVAELSAKSGVSRNAIHSIEAGREPYDSTAGKLAIGLGITLEELVEDAEALQEVS